MLARHFPFSLRYTPLCPLVLFAASFRLAIRSRQVFSAKWIELRIFAFLCSCLRQPQLLVFQSADFLSDRHNACRSHIGRTTGLPELPVCLPLQKTRLLLPPLKEENVSPTGQEPAGVHSACLSDPASRVPVFFFDSSRSFWCALSSDASRLRNIWFRSHTDKASRNVCFFHLISF